MNEEKTHSDEPIEVNPQSQPENVPEESAVSAQPESFVKQDTAQTHESAPVSSSMPTTPRREVAQRPVIANYGSHGDTEGAHNSETAGDTSSARDTEMTSAQAPQATSASSASVQDNSVAESAPAPGAIPTMPTEPVPAVPASTESIPVVSESSAPTSAMAGTSAISGAPAPIPTNPTPAWQPSNGATAAAPQSSNEAATAAPPLGTAWMQAPATDTTKPNEKKKKKSHPGWAALVAVGVVAALAGGGIGVGAMTWRYDGSRPVSVAEGKPNVKPVVDAKGDTPDWGAVSEAVGPSVVAINADSRRGEAAGSGVIFDKSGHILTNNHVIAGAEKITVTLTDGRVIEAKVAGTDPATDLAVITLASIPQDLTVAALGDSTRVKVGDPVAAIGNPLGLSSTMTTGIVSALNRPVQTSGANEQTGERTRVVTNAIQIDAAVNPGNSGGPIFDAQGRVIGIASSIATLSGGSGQAGSIGLGFAIPINLAEDIAKQLVEKGVAEHAFLGVSIADGVAQYKGTSKLGAEVKSVENGTPAAAAKLQVGDVITAMNGHPVTSAASLTGYTRQHRSGEKVTLTFERNGDLQEVDVTLATRQDAQK